MCVLNEGNVLGLHVNVYGSGYGYGYGYGLVCRRWWRRVESFTSEVDSPVSCWAGSLGTTTHRSAKEQWLVPLQPACLPVSTSTTNRAFFIHQAHTIIIQLIDSDRIFFSFHIPFARSWEAFLIREKETRQSNMNSEHVDSFSFSPTQKNMYLHSLTIQFS